MLVPSSTRALVLCAALLISGSLHADDFSLRCRACLESIADRQQPPDFSIVTARVKCGRHHDEALRQLDTLLSMPRGDMFFMYASMGCLLCLRDSLSPSVRDRFRAAWKHSTFYRGDTENHFLMYYAGMYLAAQEWPGLAGGEWFNGKSSEENLREARAYLMQWSAEVSKEGLVEFDSPRYFYYQVTPLVLLYEFSRDPALRTRAELMLDFLFTDFASDYLSGAYCGAHSRDGESSTIAPRSAEAISYAGLYFGDVTVEHPLQDLAFAALSSYRLPGIIRAIAIDKPSAIVHTETARARTHIRIPGERTPVVFKYDFVTPAFALGSLSGGIAQPIQQRSWSLVFSSAKINNRIFALHPASSAQELGTFFPEEFGLLVGDIGASKVGYASENKWIGGSFSEKIFQEKNVLIALYDIPEDDPVDHIDYFLPRDLDRIERDSSGWIFLAEGRAFAAIFPLRPYAWLEEDNHVRLRSASRRNGYVVVAGSTMLRPQIRTFRAFRESILASRIDTSLFAGSCAITARIGNRAPIQFSFNDLPARDSALFADHEFGYLRSARSNAPHVSSDRGSGVIDISREGEELELDFGANVVRRK